MVYCATVEVLALLKSTCNEWKTLIDVVSMVTMAQGAANWRNTHTHILTSTRLQPLCALSLKAPSAIGTLIASFVATLCEAPSQQLQNFEWNFYFEGPLRYSSYNSRLDPARVSPVSRRVDVDQWLTDRRPPAASDGEGRRTHTPSRDWIRKRESLAEELRGLNPEPNPWSGNST